MHTQEHSVMSKQRGCLELRLTCHTKPKQRKGALEFNKRVTRKSIVNKSCLVRFLTHLSVGVVTSPLIRVVESPSLQVWERETHFTNRNFLYKWTFPL